MEKKERGLKRPMTPFFLYKNQLKAQGISISPKEAAERWNRLSEEEKKPFVDAYGDAKGKFDKYLEEVEGIPPRGSCVHGEKPLGYKIHKIRAVCGTQKEIKQMEQSLPSILAHVLVRVAMTGNRKVSCMTLGRS